MKKIFLLLLIPLFCLNLEAGWWKNVKKAYKNVVKPVMEAAGVKETQLQRDLERAAGIEDDRRREEEERRRREEEERRRREEERKQQEESDDDDETNDDDENTGENQAVENPMAENPMAENQAAENQATENQVAENQEKAKPKWVDIVTKVNKGLQTSWEIKKDIQDEMGIEQSKAERIIEKGNEVGGNVVGRVENVREATHEGSNKVAEKIIEGAWETKKDIQHAMGKTESEDEELMELAYVKNKLDRENASEEKRKEIAEKYIDGESALAAEKEVSERKEFADTSSEGKENIEKEKENEKEDFEEEKDKKDIEASAPIIMTKKGLQWSSISLKKMDELDGLVYCKQLEENGYDDWRLPSISELRTLIQNCSNTETGGFCDVTDDCLAWDKCRSDSCFGCTYDDSGIYSKFGDADILWSSSSDLDSNDNVWVISFASGRISSVAENNKHFVRCVR